MDPRKRCVSPSSALYRTRTQRRRRLEAQAELDAAVEDMLHGGPDFGAEVMNAEDGAGDGPPQGDPQEAGVVGDHLPGAEVAGELEADENGQPAVNLEPMAVQAHVPVLLEVVGVAVESDAETDSSAGANAGPPPQEEPFVQPAHAPLEAEVHGVPPGDAVDTDDSDNEWAPGEVLDHPADEGDLDEDHGAGVRI